MESITVLLMLFILLAAGGAIVLWLMIHQRRGRHEIQTAEDSDVQEVEEIRPPMLALEHRLVAGQEEVRIAEETHLPGEKGQSAATQKAEWEIPQEARPTAVPETKVTVSEKSGSRTMQGAEQIEGEETHTQTVVEELQPVTTETKQTVPGVSPATTPEGSKPISIEEARRQVVEERQPIRAKRESLQAKERRREPIERGGRPRGPTQPQKRRTTRKATSRRPKPEIVCWKRARQWLIGVEVPEDLFREGDDLEVYQDGSPLSRDDSREGCWLLNSISGQVTVQWNEGDAIEEVNLALGQDGYLLFKLSGEGLNQGRLVKSASSGSYLVAAPDSWERDERVAGAPPVMPESVALDEYSAHFFDLEKGGETRIAFRTPEGDPITVPLSSARFELVGEQLEDADEYRGPLFRSPPKIRALNAQAWKGVKTIVIGEEGGGRGKWRTAFNPDTERQEQELPFQLRERRGGWYFLRFYDGNDELIESMDFRFLSGLKEIRTPKSSPTPSEDGHDAVCVQLFHEPGITIQAIENLPNIPIERGDSQTTLTIPPDYASDVTRWLVGHENGPQVEVTILVERLWWSLGEEAAEPSQWEDKPLALSPDDLTATSNKAIWLRLPRRRWTDKVCLGFEKKQYRSYEIKVTKSKLCIPLRELGDFQKVEDVGIIPLIIWFTRRDTTYRVILGNLTVRVNCGLCDFIADDKEDILRHIKSTHLGELFPPLTYDELRNLIPSLPFKIYRCSYCNFYVSSDDLHNPTSAICTHIEKECPRAPRGGGPITIRFQAISDVKEIRKSVIKDLPKKNKCMLCNCLVEEDTTKMMQHLIRSHRDKLYNLQ